MSATAIDEVILAVSEYSRTHFGVKNGSDFHEVARALMESQQFKNIRVSAAAMGFLFSIIRPPSKEKFKSDPSGALDELMRDSPVSELMADVFYMGYCAGKRATEVGELEKLGPL